jgi:fatty acid desaturase
MIHHLFPTVPLYKMQEVRYLTYDGLSAWNVSDLSAFGLTPANIGLRQAHSNLN